MSAPRLGAETLRRVEKRVVGRRSELEGIVAALAAGRHLLLEGPPGTGKSTVLRSIADACEQGFEFVEGNAELTPARLIGSFDPSQVLVDGYSERSFVDGPLATAMRSGALLYIEEINRVPEETLNVMVTVMSEAELHVPRLGRIDATPGFRLVAAMNPFDAIGTARIASAVYDRCCRLAMGYQDPDDERRIVRREAPAAAESLGGRAVDTAVRMVRATREHPDVRSGASVRGAIDFVLVAHELAALRQVGTDDDAVTLDAALLALSGRLRVREGAGRSAEDVVTELWQRHFGSEPDGSGHPESTGSPPGKA